MTNARSPSLPRPWVAALLSLFLPGLGHLYARRPAYFFLAVASIPIVGLMMLSGMLYLPGILSPLSALILLVPYVALARHAWVTAQHASSDGRRSRWVRWPGYLAILLVASYANEPLVSMVRQDYARAFRATSVSMEPTLMQGDYLLASRRPPDDLLRGVVVTYIAPDDSMELVGRIVALGGDTVAMADGRLTVNHSAASEPYVLYSDSTDTTFPGFLWQMAHLTEPTPADSSYRPTARNWGPLLVPDETVFILGDHRNMSADSRYRGFTPVVSITGVPLRVYFSRGGPEPSVRWGRIGHWIR